MSGLCSKNIIFGRLGADILNGCFSLLMFVPSSVPLVW
jgi:hypothetical protein